MKNLLIIFFAVLSIHFSPAIAQTKTKTTAAVQKPVYIVKAETIYHTATCKVTDSKRKTAISKKEAIASGFTPCKICKP